MNQPSGQLQSFIVSSEWAEVWDNYLSKLNLDGREYPNQGEFENFKKLHENKLRILDADESVIVVYPWAAK